MKRCVWGLVMRSTFTWSTWNGWDRAASSKALTPEISAVITVGRPLGLGYGLQVEGRHWMDD